MDWSKEEIIEALDLADKLKKETKEKQKNIIY